ncbi:MAG TPA: hypothetical protein VD997_13655 [Phycisphaerales bacterium]|nr:hypothetical protein [Phycisphaerales bacterium]
MADNRQIRVGAGLEESKYNEEFIDWLRKWGVPILFVVALVAAAYGLRMRWRQSQEAKLDTSFSELESVISGANPSPDSLLQIASDHADAGSAVAAIARLEAADAYLDSVRRGVRPGVTVKADGTLDKPEDALKPEEKAGFLTKAGDLYAQVYNDLRNDDGKRILAIGALYGMAAVAEDQNDLAKAKANYDEIVKLAEAGGLTAHIEVAKERIAKLDELKNVTPPFAKADLPPVPEAPKPPAPTLTPIDPSQLPPGLQPQPLPPPAQPPQTDPLRQPTTPSPTPAPATNPEQPAPAPANPPTEPAPANPQTPPAEPTTPPASQPTNPPAPQPENPPAPK